MGLFDWFNKPKMFELLGDRIWKTRGAKLEGMVREIEDWSGEDDRVLVVAHFPATLKEACEALRQANIDFEQGQHEWDSRNISGLYQHNNHRPVVVLAESLPDTFPDDQPNPVGESSSIISVIVIERHPLASQDDHVARFARSLPSRSRLGFFLSLDDPLMQIFAGDAVRRIVEQFDGPEDQGIENQLFIRCIRGTQRKIKKKVFGNSKAESAQEWLERNLPP
jgi:hypothetical protein